MIWEGIASTFRVCNVLKKELVGVPSAMEDASAYFNLVQLSPPDSKSPCQIRLYTKNKFSLPSCRLVKYRPSKDGLI